MLSDTFIVTIVVEYNNPNHALRAADTFALVNNMGL